MTDLLRTTAVGSVTCADCGAELEERHAATPRGSCPHCGSTALTYTQAMTVTLTLDGWRDWVQTHRREINRLLVAVSAVLTVACVVVGNALAGAVGIVVGLVVSIGSTIAGARAVRHVRETEQRKALH